MKAFWPPYSNKWRNNSIWLDSQTTSSKQSARAFSKKCPCHACLKGHNWYNYVPACSSPLAAIFSCGKQFCQSGSGKPLMFCKFKTQPTLHGLWCAVGSELSELCSQTPFRIVRGRPRFWPRPASGVALPAELWKALLALYCFCCTMHHVVQCQQLTS